MRFTIRNGWPFPLVVWCALCACLPDAAAAFQARPGQPVVVAVTLTDGANVIDFSGPWEVFQDTADANGNAAFRLYTVSDTRDPVHLTGGLTVIPDYTFDNAPPPNLIVVGAQRGSAKLDAWLRAQSAAPGLDAMVGVCTGAFRLGQAGLLDGKAATTHHDFFDKFEKAYPKAKLERGARFVQGGPHLFTAGGLTSGIDLALHVVSLYFGDATAKRTAAYMEYRQGT